MSDHEQLHEAREREADELERESERLGDDIEGAKKANKALEQDELIATPESSEQEGEEPPPEAQYPAKD
jgi:hypothetical protein